jgi:CysZ protein
MSHAGAHAGAFVRGVRAPGRALRLLMRERRLRRLALLPFLINIVLVAVGVPLAMYIVVRSIDGIDLGAGAISESLRLLLEIIAAAGVIVAAFFGFVIVGNIIAAPFNAKLSEAIEELHTGAPVRGSGIVASAGTSIAVATGRLFIFIILYPPILATALIPVVGFIINPLLTALYGAFVLSLDFSDPTFERHLKRFRSRVAFIRSHAALYLGFGLVAVAMMLVPFLNLLMIPIGVTAAAMLYLEEERSSI